MSLCSARLISSYSARRKRRSWNNGRIAGNRDLYCRMRMQVSDSRAKSGAKKPLIRF